MRKDVCICLFSCHCVLGFVQRSMWSSSSLITHCKRQWNNSLNKLVSCPSPKKIKEKKKITWTFCVLFSPRPFLVSFFLPPTRAFCERAPRTIVQTFFSRLRSSLPLRWFGIRGFSYGPYYVAWWDSISPNQRRTAARAPSRTIKCGSLCFGK